MEIVDLVDLVEMESMACLLCWGCCIEDDLGSAGVRRLFDLVLVVTDEEAEGDLWVEAV